VLSLRRKRQAVVSAASADSARRLVSDRAVSAVVVDVANPSLDWKTCGTLVETAEAGVPVVVLTGWVGEDARERAFGLGCAAFVVKPASPDRLLEVLRRARGGERNIVVVA
jgi:two-component system C4-dicarboxylate transport response regulator DctD